MLFGQHIVPALLEKQYRNLEEQMLKIVLPHEHALRHCMMETVSELDGVFFGARLQNHTERHAGSLIPYCTLGLSPLPFKSDLWPYHPIGTPFSLYYQSCKLFCKYIFLPAELLGGDLTDDIICDIGMPVIHRYAVMPIAWQCNARVLDACCFCFMPAATCNFFPFDSACMHDPAQHSTACHNLSCLAWCSMCVSMNRTDTPSVLC